MAENNTPNITGGRQPQANLPARGLAQPIPQQRGQNTPVGTSVVTSDVPQAGEVAPSSGGNLGAAPGSVAKHDSSGMTLTGLGTLDDVLPAVETEPEGEGDKCVVLVELLSGDKGRMYHKGQVKRLSLLIRGWDDDNKSFAKQEAKRLFDLRAVRLATREEQNVDFVEIRPEAETEVVSQERNLRIQAEAMIEDLRRQNDALRAQMAEGVPDTRTTGETTGGPNTSESPAPF